VVSNKPLNLKQVLDILGMHENTVYQYIKSGKLKAYKVGNRWRIYEIDLDKFIRGEN
jgi:excisionase family DNA binding protein